MLGTTKSNAADMILKGRQSDFINAASGEGNGNSKLTLIQVTEIRRSYSNKELNQYELEEKFRVTQTTVGLIVRNKTWRKSNV